MSSLKEVPNEDTIYIAILPILLNCISEAKSIEDIADQLNLKREQILNWVNRAVRENRVRETGNPVKYMRND